MSETTPNTPRPPAVSRGHGCTASRGPRDVGASTGHALYLPRGNALPAAAQSPAARNMTEKAALIDADISSGVGLWPQKKC